MSDIIRSPRSQLSRLGWTLLACVLVTLPLLPLHAYLDPANTAMIYLLMVAIVAARAGKYAAIFAAFNSVLLLDFFFVPPRFSFVVGDVQYVIMLAVMLAVALIISNLTIVLQQQTAVAMARERQSRALYDLASKLAGALSLEQVAEATRRFLSQLSECRVVFLIRRNDELVSFDGSDLLQSEEQHAAAHCAMREGKTTQVEACAKHWLFLPLPGSTYTRGVLAVCTGDNSPESASSQRPLLEAVASLNAIAVERLHFVEVAQRAQLQMTDERLRNSILSALSHDIRTPLTVLYGMADTLSLSQLPPTARDSVDAMREQVLRLNSMVGNLLDMARLHKGTIRLNLEWQPVEEVIGASIKLLDAALAQHRVKVVLPPDMPLLKLDAVLMERVLCNLLENAAKYSPPCSAIVVQAKVLGEEASLSVCDSGSGFPPDKLDKVFEMFERGDTESSIPGVGLGLAICRNIVEAHGGRIQASNCEGACVMFTIPLGKPPAVETDDDE